MAAGPRFVKYQSSGNSARAVTTTRVSLIGVGGVAAVLARRAMPRAVIAIRI